MIRKSMLYLVYDYEYFIGRSGLYASRAKLDNQAFSFIDLTVKFGKNIITNFVVKILFVKGFRKKNWL